jgi:dTDP-L-rhamnose 4-epimerase
VYGATKLAQEHMLGAWATSYGAEVAVLRLQNVFGPGQSLANPYTGIVPLFCRLAREGRSIPLYEDGAMLRDFVLIDDVAAALLQAIDVARVPGQPVDIGSGERVSVAGLAARIVALYGAPAPHVCGLYRYGDVRHGACRIDATETLLGWRPRHGLDEGLAMLARWIETRLPQAAA